MNRMGDGRIPGGVRPWATDEIDPQYLCYIATLHDDDRGSPVVWSRAIVFPQRESPIELKSVAVSADEFWKVLRLERREPCLDRQRGLDPEG